jgi:putative GTP pyrophosphokinase
MNELRHQFTEMRDRQLIPCASALEDLVQLQLKDIARIDRITSRVKSVDRFMAKAQKTENGNKKYDYPLQEIQDIIGLRVIVLFLEDVLCISEKLCKIFRSIEKKSLKPEKHSEFSYFGWHGIFFIPTDCISDSSSASLVPSVFEIQVKTVFQHAWSEAEHDLGYKPSGKLNDEAKRMIAFAASLAWGADRAFQDVLGDKL